MRLALAPKVAVVEGDTAVAEEDKVVADVDKAETEVGEAVAVEVDKAKTEEDKVVADVDKAETEVDEAVDKVDTVAVGGAANEEERDDTVLTPRKKVSGRIPSGLIPNESK